MTLASLVFTYDGPLSVRVEHRLSGGEGTVIGTFSLPVSGFWLLTVTGPPSDISSRLLQSDLRAHGDEWWFGQRQRNRCV